jgi:hypothetical protein
MHHSMLLPMGALYERHATYAQCFCKDLAPMAQ